MVAGERSLEEKNIEDANLSKTYTNQSIRATAVTILYRSVFEARRIMAVSGHKNESSIRSSCKTDLSAKREVSASLSTECVVAGQELPDLGDHQLSMYCLSQEEFIMQNTHTENTKTINFHNCFVSFFLWNTIILLHKIRYVYNEVTCLFIMPTSASIILDIPLNLIK